MDDFTSAISLFMCFWVISLTIPNNITLSTFDYMYMVYAVVSDSVCFSMCLMHSVTIVLQLVHS